MTAQEAIILTKMALAEPEPDYDVDEYDDDMEPDYEDATPDHHHHPGLDAVGRIPPFRETIRPYIDLMSSRHTHHLFPRLVPPIIPPNHEGSVPNYIQDHVPQEDSNYNYQNFLRKRQPSSNQPQAHNLVRLYRPFRQGSCHHTRESYHRRRDSRFVRNNELERQFSKRMSPLNYV